ncbi:HAD family hydrolase [Halocatena salina]|uniref:HAD family hydrolase n=1 Tax=Halocatena salina TaxID=2934340 RepID=A0A8U0A1H7_9EURY|nr:HAD family hydrolase [Halocatena salina]UPM41847.1 HAD family hydrolase [Halocatena salina]
MVVSFDCFGTLLEVQPPTDPASAVATALADRGVSVPPDWSVAYGESHTTVPSGVEISLTEHVVHALESRGIDPDRDQCARAVTTAFAPDVRIRPGARTALAAAAHRGQIGVCSNCSVTGLVHRALARSAVDRSFDAVVTSVGCGWRKPHPRAFEAVAEQLEASGDTLVHVGDDPDADGGVEAVGGTFIEVGDGSLETVPERLRELDR